MATMVGGHLLNVCVNIRGMKTYMYIVYIPVNMKDVLDVHVHVTTLVWKIFVLKIFV